MKKFLRHNIQYFRQGPEGPVINNGPTERARFHVYKEDKIENVRFCHTMQEMLVYTSRINYPAVPLKEARSLMGVTTLHEGDQPDRVLKVFANIKKAFKL